jgi:Na+-driven multidrug efflux pump
MVFQLINQSAACIIRAEGNILYSMVVSISGNIINVALGALFIIAMRLEVRGAAYATMVSQFFGMALSLTYFIRKKSVTRILGLRALDIRIMLKILGTGIAPGIFQGLSFFTNIFINNSLRVYAVSLDGGFDLAVSAISVISSIENVALMMIMGFNNGISSIISYCYGAGNYRRVMKASLVGQALASVAAVIIWLLMMITPKALFSIFVSGADTAVLEYGAYAVHRSKLFMFFLGFQTLSSMYYSAIGKPRWATLISVSRNGLFLIPALLTLPGLLGLDGVLYATSVSDALSAVFVGFIYLRGMRDLKKQIRGQELDGSPVLPILAESGAAAPP